jgi:hypothetical protein
MTDNIVKKSKSMGVGGFLRALWDYVWNSLTKSWSQAKLNVVVEDYLKDNPEEVDDTIGEITTNTSSQDPKVVRAFVTALKKLIRTNSMVFVPQ